MELFRPVTESEYQAIAEAEFLAFPQCPVAQATFTALLAEDGAVEIARHMKTAPGEGETVYVLRFLVEDSYIRQFPIQNTDEPNRQAIWLDAEALALLNQHLIGKINVVEAFDCRPAARDTFFA